MRIKNESQFIVFFVQILLFSIFSLVGCSPHKLELDSQHPKMEQETPVNFFISTSTIYPTAIGLKTSTPTENSNDTQIFTKSITPSISVEKSTDFFLQSMIDNQCEFPCWGNLIVGKTNYDEAVKKISSMSKKSELSTKTPCVKGSICQSMHWSFMSEKTDYMNGYLIETDGMLNTIELETTYHKSIYSIENILKKYGKPENIFVIPPEAKFEKKMDYSVVLSYPQNQFIVQYKWNIEFIGENWEKFTSCNHEGNGHIWIVDKDISGWSMDWIEMLMNNNVISKVNLMRPISQVSNWDIDQFYTKLITPNNSECITYSWNAWTN